MQSPGDHELFFVCLIVPVLAFACVFRTKRRVAAGALVLYAVAYATARVKPEVITLDVIMPGMDGWAVLAALKGNPDLADIPVIMMTILEVQMKTPNQSLETNRRPALAFHTGRPFGSPVHYPACM
jgi:Response regulator receiver domain